MRPNGVSYRYNRIFNYYITKKNRTTMAAEYDFQRKPNPKGDGELQPMYPRIVNKGTITGKRLVSDISQATSFTPGDVEGVLAAL